MKSIVFSPLVAAIICTVAVGSSMIHAESLEVDKTRSRIQVDIQATGHFFTSELKDYKVTATGDASTLVPSGFELTWNFKSLDSDDAKRDSEMVKWLGGGQPQGSFKFIKTWTDAKGKTQAMGTLTVHGISKTIAFPYQAEKSGKWVTIRGSAGMNYQDFGLPIIRSMAVMTVDPKLVVRFQIVGQIK